MARPRYTRRSKVKVGLKIGECGRIMNFDFVLCSFGVSQAFVKGMAFEELSALTGTELR